MKGKATLILGMAAGYVLGTRDGRERYEQIKSQANRLWNDPKVQEKASQAQDVVKEKAPKVQEKVSDAAHKAGSKVTGGSESRTAVVRPDARPRPDSTGLHRRRLAVHAGRADRRRSPHRATMRTAAMAESTGATSVGSTASTTGTTTAGTTTAGGAGAEPTTGELVSRLTQQTTELVRSELALAKTEMAAKAKHAGVGAGLFGGAGIIALYGVGTLVATAILALALVMDAWLAALIVTVVLFVVAGVVALVGKKQVSQATPAAPERTIDNVKRDVEAVKGGSVVMTSPDQTTTSSNGTGAEAKPDVEEIQANIEQTRQELGETVEALTAKLDVKSRTKAKVADTKVRTKAKVADTRVKAVDTLQGAPGQGVPADGHRPGRGDRRRPASPSPPSWPVSPACVAVVLAVTVVVWRQRR